jgi:hypothetical protein
VSLSRLAELTQLEEDTFDQLFPFLLHVAEGIGDEDPNGAQRLGHEIFPLLDSVFR